MRWLVRVTFSRSSFIGTPGNRGYWQSFHYQLGLGECYSPLPGYLDTNNECIVVWVVEKLSVFFRESNYRVVDKCHLWDETYKLDILNHLKVSLMSLLR